MESDGRLDKLEQKVDQIVDFSHQLMTSQELIQQELGTMNKTLATVNELNIKVIQLASDFHHKTSELDIKLTLGLDNLHEKNREVRAMFTKRDNIVTVLATSVILMLLESAWTALTK